MPQGLAIATVDVSFPLLAPDGSAAAPSYSFAASPSTGIYSGAANVVDVSAGGVSYLRTAPGYVGVRSELRVGGYAGDNTNFVLDQPTAVIARMTGGNVYCLALMNDGSGNPLTVLSMDCGFGWNSNNFLTTNTAMDLVLRRDAADTLAQRRGTNAQFLRIYNTYTSGAVYERASIGWGEFNTGTIANFFVISTQAAGGASARSIWINSADNLYFTAGGSGSGQWRLMTTGHLICVTDNTYDLGATGFTPRNVYAGTQFLGPDGSAASPSYSFASSTNTGFKCPAPGYVDLSVGGSVRYRWFDGQFYMGSVMTLGWSSNADAAVAVADLSLARLAAASLRLGLAPSATPVAQTFTIGEASRPGTDTNVGGANGTIRSGLGTGTGTASLISFQTPTLAASGSGAQTYTTRLDVASNSIAPKVPVYAFAGSVGAPAYSFASQTDTGIFNTGTILEFASGGVLIARLSTSLFLTQNVDMQLSSLGNVYWANGVAGSAAVDLGLARLGGASLRLGLAPSATPINQTFTVGESSRGTTDNNVAGANGTLRCGAGTGNAAGASLIFETPTPTASGVVAQAYAQRLSLSVLGATFDIPDQGLRINNQVNGAGASAGTLTNAPSAGNPNFWLPLNVNGTVYMFPGW